jgi:hypothetical protein
MINQTFLFQGFVAHYFIERIIVAITLWIAPGRVMLDANSCTRRFEAIGVHIRCFLDGRIVSHKSTNLATCPIWISYSKSSTVRLSRLEWEKSISPRRKVICFWRQQGPSHVGYEVTRFYQIVVIWTDTKWLRMPYNGVNSKTLSLEYGNWFNFPTFHLDWAGSLQQSSWTRFRSADFQGRESSSWLYPILAMYTVANPIFNSFSDGLNCRR